MAPQLRDPLAEVLSLLRPETVLAAELRAHGRWRLAFDAQPTDVKFGVIVEGECLFALRGCAPTTLRAGDVFLLGAAPRYVLASDMRAPSQSGSDVIHRSRRRVVRLGSKRETPVTHVIGGRFVLSGANGHLLVEAIPPFVRIPANEAGALRDVTRLLVDEVRSTKVGRIRALDQLAQLVLTYALRWHFGSATRPRARSAWRSSERPAAHPAHIGTSLEASRPAEGFVTTSATGSGWRRPSMVG